MLEIISEPILWITLASIVLGGFAGLSAGLLGIGGGLIIVPGLILIFTFEGMLESRLAHMAIGTSLAIIIPTAVSSLWAHQRRGNIIWPVFYQLTPALLIGAFLGAMLADQMASVWLQRTFGVFALIVSVRLFQRPARPTEGRDLPLAGVWASGGIIGGISSLVGIGGGSMTVPLLVWLGKPMHMAVGTSAACGLPIALAGTTGFVLTGMSADLGSGLRLGYVDWPKVLLIGIFSVLAAPQGARLSSILPVVALRRIFAFMLAVVGLRLLF